MNTFGHNLRLTTFGESHGPAVGGVLDGMPSRVMIDFAQVGAEMAARRPGQHGASARAEDDIPEFLSGISPEGLTLGTPIGFIIRNRDARSSDYERLRHAYRPGHADYTYDVRYGIRDHRGGGRSSARETASRVVGGAIAMQWLATLGISVEAALVGVGKVQCPDLPLMLARNPELRLSALVDGAALMEEIGHARNDGDSVGGMVACTVRGLKAGVGSPVYGKLHARLAEAMMGINAAKGFDYGLGMLAAEASGYDVADRMRSGEAGRPRFLSDFSGGVQGGISDGMPVFFRVAFKPTPSLPRELETVDDAGHEIDLAVSGRHDPCVALRAVPVVKAMAALTVADALLDPNTPC